MRGELVRGSCPILGRGDYIRSNARDTMESFIALPAIFLLRNVNFEEPQNILYARMAMMCTVVVLVSVHFLLSMKIKQNKKEGTVRVLKTGTTDVYEEMTISEYDLSQLSADFTQNLMGVGIVSFLHYQFQFIQPLCIQSIMLLVRLFQTNLVKCYFFGSDIARPFPAPKPSGLGALFSGGAAAEDLSSSQASVTSSSESNAVTNADNGGAKTKKANSTQKARLEILEDDVEMSAEALKAQLKAKEDELEALRRQVEDKSDSKKFQ